MKDTKPPLTMELLAPAGTIECFRAAIDAGANAVYLGLPNFNARLRAKNFTMKTLSYAVPFAHDRNVKVYVAFNTLVKQAELEVAAHFLHQIEQIGVDAVIVQDLGVADIAKRDFPRLSLHASTQMSVHNSAGLDACKRLGIRRVVAARELTIEELKNLCAAQTIEVEVFAHGALCYCLSGMCLASSFFGGLSGNRGRCTQVCRRAFAAQPQFGESPGYFFSPGDLCAIDMLQELSDAGVASIKIEGRMKGADYVRTVTSAYRMAIDEPAKTDAAKELLHHDRGRRKTSLFFGGIVQENIIDAKNPAGTGLYLGTIENIGERKLTIRTKVVAVTGDIIRVQPHSGAEGVMAGVLGSALENGMLSLVLDNEIACLPGDVVYCVGRSSMGDTAETRLPAVPVRYNEKCAEAHEILMRYGSGGHKDKNRDRRLFVKIDSYGWLPFLNLPQVGGVICSFNRDDMQRFAQDAPMRDRLGRAAYIEPPPFISGDELGEWRRLIVTLCKDGLCGLMCQNLGHVMIEPGVKRVRGDYPLWCTNRASQAAYAALGVGYVAYSLEDDHTNIRAIASQNGMAYLFTHVPLFISRIKPALPPGCHITDRCGRKTVTREKSKLYYLLAEEIVSLFHKRKKFEELGIRTFCVDLSFMAPQEGVLREILYCYANEKKFPGSCLFNFKGGLQ
jgi:putative protease